MRSLTEIIVESWIFAEREGSPRDVDGDAQNAPTPVPGDLHQ